MDGFDVWRGKLGHFLRDALWGKVALATKAVDTKDCWGTSMSSRIRTRRS